MTKAKGARTDRTPRRGPTLDPWQTYAWLLALVVLAASADAAGRDTRLVEAVKAGNRDGLHALLQTPGLVNVAEPDGTTALHWAALADDIEMVRRLLQAGARPDSRNQYGVTPLAAAATSGHAPVIEALLRAGADPNAALPEGETVLMTAARAGRVEVIEALLNYGADVTSRELLNGESALVWAAAQDHAAAVRLLVTYGADVNGRSTTAAAGRRGARGGWTPLMYASRQRSLEALRALLDAGARLDDTDPDGTTALIVAIRSAHYDVAAALLRKGADPNIADRTGMSPLYTVLDMASLPFPFGRPDRVPTGPPDNAGLLTMMLEYGADPNARLKTAILQHLRTQTDGVLGEGATPFMRAAKAGNLPAMRDLLDYGADPTVAQKNGTTALMIAAGLGWRDGYPIKAPFASIRDRATEHDAIAAITLCLSLGADVNAANSDGDTALHGAAEARGSVPIVRFLVEHGARMEAKNRLGQTPLDAAFAHRERAGILLRTAAVAELRTRMGLPPVSETSRPQ